MRDRRRTREDIDIPEHGYAKDHHYYSGPATSRVIPETGISAQKPTASVVSVPTGLQAQNALYAPEMPHEEKTTKDEIKQAAVDHPDRDLISKALEHIQSNEVGTEYFHDTLVDNNKGSYHYQQPIAVKNVVGARNSGGLFSWNGIGGIFGTGASLGDKDGRKPVPIRASVRSDGSLNWHDDDSVVNTERILQAGTGIDGEGFHAAGDDKDLAEQVLRVSAPNVGVRANSFLGYDPQNPPPPARENEYIHSWAAYTPEGSKRRMDAAKGEEAFLEWKKTHKKQVCCRDLLTSFTATLNQSHTTKENQWAISSRTSLSIIRTSPFPLPHSPFFLISTYEPETDSPMPALANGTSLKLTVPCRPLRTQAWLAMQGTPCFNGKVPCDAGPDWKPKSAKEVDKEGADGGVDGPTAK